MSTEQSSEQVTTTSANTGGGFNLLNPASWLNSIGGSLASGIEGGFVSFAQDIWQVLIGPVYILIGAWILLFTLGVYFRHPIMNVGSKLMQAGIMAAMMA